MRCLSLENTSIYVSRLSFGTASLHQTFNSQKRRCLLETAAASGITHFDTSPFYGYGLAEIDLGKFIKGKRQAFTIATKVGLYPKGGYSGNATSVWMRKALGKVLPTSSLPKISAEITQAKTSLEQSLRRLNTDYVDFLFLHELDSSLVSIDELMRWIEFELSRGTIRSWGIAGVRDRVVTWLNLENIKIPVIQTQDSIDETEANFLSEFGLNFQFTYGYLSSQANKNNSFNAQALISKALERNRTGSIIISSRNQESIINLAKECM